MLFLLQGTPGKPRPASQRRNAPPSLRPPASFRAAALEAQAPRRLASRPVVGGRQAVSSLPAPCSLVPRMRAGSTAFMERKTERNEKEEREEGRVSFVCHSRRKTGFATSAELAVVPGLQPSLSLACCLVSPSALFSFPTSLNHPTCGCWSNGSTEQLRS